jgi:hypothetical protein
MLVQPSTKKAQKARNDTNITQIKMVSKFQELTKRLFLIKIKRLKIKQKDQKYESPYSFSLLEEIVTSSCIETASSTKSKK